MQFAAHRAELLKRGPDGVAERARLSESAKRGNLAAIKKLAFPRYPDSLAYLDAMHKDLCLGRGDSMNGMAPFTWPEIESASRQMGWDLARHELRGLLLVDSAVRSAMQSTDEQTDKPSSVVGEIAEADRVRPKWPAKKPELMP